MADINKNTFDESKNYTRLIYQRGRDVADFELNEMADIERILRRRTNASIFGDGFLGVGFQILPSANPNEILIEQGDSLIQGEHVNNPARFPIENLTTPSGSDRTDIVYLEVREVEIDSTQDPNIEGAGVGELARRIQLQYQVIIDEGSSTLPTITGDIHDAGIHYQLIGFLSRLDGIATISQNQILDARRLISFFALNEDRNLELIGGGEVLYTQGTGRVDWDNQGLGGGSLSAPGNIVIVQPSSPGDAIIDADDAANNPFFLANNGDCAYVNLDRDAATDYFTNIIVSNINSVPNNTNTFVIAFRGFDDKLYFRDGSIWDDGQAHLIRTNPFTGQIVDADVAPAADIQGTKIAVASLPYDRLTGVPVFFPVGGIFLWDQSNTCPAGSTQVHYGSANDVYIRIAASGNSPITTPGGSNSHGHGTHNHGVGTYHTDIPAVTIGTFGGAGSFLSDPMVAPAPTFEGNFRTRTFNLIGTSGDTAVSSASHEPKRVQLLLCKKT